MTQITDEVYAVLQDVCSTEAEILGDSVVRELSEGYTAKDFADAGAGEHLDLSTVLDVTAKIAALITALIKLREEWIKSRVGANGEIEALRARVRELESAHSEVPPDKQRAIESKVFSGTSLI
jgi:hypothetical protein